MIPGAVSITADQYYANREWLVELSEQRVLYVYHSSMATAERYAWIWPADEDPQSLLCIMLKMK